MPRHYATLCRFDQLEKNYGNSCKAGEKKFAFSKHFVCGFFVTMRFVMWSGLLHDIYGFGELFSGPSAHLVAQPQHMK